MRRPAATKAQRQHAREQRALLLLRRNAVRFTDAFDSDAASRAGPPGRGEPLHEHARTARASEACEVTPWLAVAHAHRAQLDGLQRRERALDRLAAIRADQRAAFHTTDPGLLPLLEWRRWLRAQVAWAAAAREAFTTYARHSKLYRSYLRCARRALATSPATLASS